MQRSLFALFVRHFTMIDLIKGTYYGQMVWYGWKQILGKMLAKQTANTNFGHIPAHSPMRDHSVRYVLCWFEIIIHIVTTHHKFWPKHSIWINCICIKGNRSFHLFFCVCRHHEKSFRVFSCALLASRRLQSPSSMTACLPACLLAWTQCDS